MINQPLLAYDNGGSESRPRRHLSTGVPVVAERPVYLSPSGPDRDDRRRKRTEIESSPRPADRSVVISTRGFFQSCSRDFIPESNEDR